MLFCSSKYTKFSIIFVTNCFLEYGSKDKFKLKRKNDLSTKCKKKCIIMDYGYINNKNITKQFLNVNMKSRNLFRVDISIDIA